MAPQRTNEAWLLDLAAQGERQAQAIDDLRRLLLRGALYTCHRHQGGLADWDEAQVTHLAEDCAQDALIAVLAHLDDFRGASKFTTWAYKFAINITLAAARRESWRSIPLPEHSEEDDLAGLLAEAGGPFEPGAERLALQEEILAAIREVIRTELTPRQREVLVLMVFDEVPMDVVVERLGANRNTIYKLLHDTRLKLKAGLIKRGIEPGEALSVFGAHR